MLLGRRVFVQHTRHVKTKDCLLAILQSKKLRGRFKTLI